MSIDTYQPLIQAAQATTSQRAKARFKMTKPNGDVAFPIDDCSDVSDAWALRGRSKSLDKAAVERHIRRAAKALGCDGPWSAATQEDESELYVFLSLEGGELPAPHIIQEASQDSGGRMRIRVPFIIGNSKSRAPGFKDPLYFPNGIVQEVVGEAQSQIDAARQPLTVYGRHAHALSRDRFPIGAVVGAERSVVDGREIGSAILEIEPTTDGRDAMVLLRAVPPKLNAVSLRAAPGKYTFERQKVDGVPHLVAQSPFGISGIDFAPDGPAMETYGVEILHQEVSLEPLDTTPSKEDELLSEELTLEVVRGNATIVQAIEAPLREQLAAVTQERDSVVAERDALRKTVRKAEKDAYVAKIGAKMTEAQRTLLQAYAETVESKEEVATQVAEILLEAPAPSAPVKSPLDNLKDSFFPTPNGSASAGVAVVQEDTPQPEPSRSVVMAEGEDPLPF